MWLDRPMLLYALHGVRTPAGIATSVVVGLGLFGCLVLLRRSLAEPSLSRRSPVSRHERDRDAVVSVA
jgi:hypothetical protein